MKNNILQKLITAHNLFKFNKDGSPKDLLSHKDGLTLLEQFKVPAHISGVTANHFGPDALKAMADNQYNKYSDNYDFNQVAPDGTTAAEHAASAIHVPINFQNLNRDDGFLMQENRSIRMKSEEPKSNGFLSGLRKTLGFVNDADQTSLIADVAQKSNLFRSADGLISFEEKKVQKAMKDYAVAISQSAKFYIDLSEDQLTEKELCDVTEDLKWHLPYKDVFLQVDYGQTIDHIHLHDHMDADRPCVLAHVCTYHERNVNGKTGYFTWDPVYYSMDITPDLWSKEAAKGTLEPSQINYSINWGPVGSYYEGLEMLVAKVQGQHPSIQQSIAKIFKGLQMLNVLLQYPSVAQVSDHAGRKNVFIDKYIDPTKTSQLRQEPKFEHKTLRLDLYGSSKGGASLAGGDRSGKAFHSVRKHLRRYKDGKKVFVKAHFRGNKDYGVIMKDYDIDPSQVDNQSKLLH